MRAKLTSLAGLLAALAGCSTLAGLDDVAYEDGAPTTGTSPTDPAPSSASGEGGTTTTTTPASADAALPSADDASVDPMDAGVDAVVEVDAAPDAPDPVDDDPPPPGVHPGPGGCSPADFAANDRRAPNAQRTIVIVPAAGAVPAQYSPRCMTVRPGQSVTWQLDFAVNPLEARSQNPQSPIMPVAAGNSATFSFGQKGRYRYGSAANPALRGAIDVHW